MEMDKEIKFCIARLGKDSLAEINRILEFEPGDVHSLGIRINCKQVPLSIDQDTVAFLWLGSDNNKGVPTDWKQGIRAIGTITGKLGGPRYNDEWQVSIQVAYIFPNSVDRNDLLKSDSNGYLRISGMPVLGIDAHANQTVQLIDHQKEDQSVGQLLLTLSLSAPGFKNWYTYNIPELKDGDSGIHEPSSEPISIGFLPKNEPEVEEADESDESDESDGGIKIPFNPKSINIEFKQFPLQVILERFEYGEINLQTEFQRKFIWPEKRQNQLIESILLRLPLPTFYFDANDDNRWEIVDGMQRLSTINRFVNGDKNNSEGSFKKLKLSGLEFLNDLEGQTYDTLPREMQRGIKIYEISAAIIRKGTPPEVKFNIFKRINTGGAILKPQEIRHALNSGVPSAFVKRLADSDEFRNATNNSIPTERMLDRDFVTRFISFYLIPYHEYQPDLDSFLSKGMALIGRLDEGKREEIEKAFRSSMRACLRIWGDDAFRRREDESTKRSPINKALFEVISVSIGKLKEAEIEDIVSNSGILRKGLIELMRSQRFKRSITQATGNLDAVLTRFKSIEELLSQILHDHSSNN
jgi:Protein of unknown function DUF262